MKNWYQSLSVNYKTSLWTAIVVIVATFITIPLMINGKYEYSISILLGGLIGCLSYLFFGLNDQKEATKKNKVITLTVIFAKLLIVVGLAFLFGWLYYGSEIHIFEPFSFIGGYFVSAIVLFVLYIVDLVKGRKAHA